MDSSRPSVDPDALLDSLYIIRCLRDEGVSPGIAEVHLFAYLGCLLWLYRTNNLADWGYSFAGTELGAPYSVAIGAAVQEMVGRGILSRTTDGLLLSTKAAERLKPIEQLSINRPRLECLRAACESAVPLTPGIINSALAEEPELKRARATPVNRPLLEEAARSQLYEHFEALRLGFEGRQVDLRLPAVVWLSALYRAARPVN